MPMRRALALLPLVLVAAAPAVAATLDEAMAAALAGNPSVVQADAGVAAAKARVAQADGALLPTATLSGSYGTGRLDPKGYFGLQAADVTPRAAMATVEQPLFAGGRILAGRTAAREGRTAAEAQAGHARARVQVAVADAWARLAVSAREVAMRARQLDQMREISRQAALRFKAGDAPSTDLSQARAREAEAEAGLEGAKAGREAAAARFTALTGLAAEADGAIPLPPDGPADRASAVAAALAGNPALAASSGAARAAGAQARAARADWLPTVGAFAEASAVRDQFFPDYVADQAVVGVRARWTLFDGGRQGRIAEAGAAAQAARAAEDQARRDTEAEAIAAFEALGAQRRMVEATARRETAAAEALRSTRLEVKTGMKPQLALLDAEREALDAAVARARAEGGLLVAGWQMKALTGGREP
jgi:outer membrane protein